MSRLRDIKRKARGDIHREMAVPTLYFATSTADPVECNVRVWLKTEQMIGADVEGGAEMAVPEDRIRIDLAEIPAPRRLAVLSVEAGEAYRIDHLYPENLGYQTARVVRLSDAETAGLAVPE